MTAPLFPSPYHDPALSQEMLVALSLRPGDGCVDATLGDGGHARYLLEATAPDGRLLGIDADAGALGRAGARLRSFADRLVLVKGNFASLGLIAAAEGFSPVAGVLFDLGLSSWQLDTAGRGFSFTDEAILDMRLDTDQPTRAVDLVNEYQQEELARIIRDYGEEPRARRIAQGIVRNRPVATAAHLARIVESVVPRRGQRVHTATRTFQALRIAVNRDLENLDAGLRQTLDVVGSGGRVVVIAYHSLEDRVVKEFMRRESRDCICPPGTPKCNCGHVSRVRVTTKKVVRPAAEQVRRNPRVRSARLRACEVI